MVLKSSLLLAGAAMCASAACVLEFDNWSGPKLTKDVELSHTVSSSTKEIMVDSYNGSVSIEVGPAGSVSGTSKIYARGRNEESAQVRLDSISWSFEDESNGRLVVKLCDPISGGSNNAGGSASLKVPAGVRVYIDSSNGAVDVNGDFPYAWVDTSNGPVTIAGVREVEADTSNGAIYITGADGKVYADTSNGPITFSGASPDFTLDSSNGGIEVTLVGNWSGKGHADTSNGNVVVNCSGVLDCTMDASTSNGKVYSPKLEGGRGKLHLDTSNGSITVKQGSGE
ncbi:MAG: hypothetical protein O3A20_01370 [Planctomycetota bacterium]|nr:hypothetical protein [Planctomycetota bacterium]